MMTSSHPSFVGFLERIKQYFPQDFISLDPSELAVYGTDWTRVYPPCPSAVVFPRTTQEVVLFVKICEEFRIAVVPSGGRTGLSGGAVAAHGEVVLSLQRMNQLEPVDPLALSVRVQAGAITEAVHHHCAAHGLTWPVDFASKGSSQVGGNIATNAGGVKVIRYGLTRHWVLGLQVVTMQGDILELNGALEKNNTGVDLRQLFIGSEGTLGIITAATLKLTKLPGQLDVFFFGLNGIDDVLKLFQEARKGPFEISAFECLTRNCFELVTTVRAIQSPFEKFYPAYVLMEIECPKTSDGKAVLDEWLASVFEKGLVLDGTLAQSPREAKELWIIREGISESLSHRGFVYKNDIALPISHLERFVDEMYEVLTHRNAALEIFLFGHIGDGNLHVNTMKPHDLDKEIFLKMCHEADPELFALVQKYSGSVSAEHGIGLLKKGALLYSRTPEEVNLMRGLKKVFDPNGLLNPGKIFDVT